ncbi:hypothetical protein GlitD10_2279 [Gloeomargarita lithophora Alchichica-D10]|uniref:DUF29 domain-containing protein n=1 Tax=Gloeomargarita lithophora Alchichica-D10 TaxID=1188229 RepID=A0A1J0AFD3_9CYAN|nr:DUF29 domain-containing protein [Gloeomargarita lithophora]APB34611.1 hypothetical protein GlitD10_2279 [Gloeomargarita lithophora Alchichica-D10]
MKDLKLTMSELYETDFALWLEQTAILLQKQDFQHLDLPNLIEEVESLGKSQKHELQSRLTTLLEHALKRKYVDSPYDYRGWEETIVREQDELKICLEDSPSLKRYWSEVFDNCYRMAKRRLVVNLDYQNYSFPKNCPFPTDVERLLNDIFWK